MYVPIIISVVYFHGYGIMSFEYEIRVCWWLEVSGVEMFSLGRIDDNRNGLLGGCNCVFLLMMMMIMHLAMKRKFMVGRDVLLSSL